MHGGKFVSRLGVGSGRACRMALVMVVLLLWGCYTKVEADRPELGRKRREAALHPITPGSFVDNHNWTELFFQNGEANADAESDENKEHQQIDAVQDDHEQEDAADREAPGQEDGQHNQLLEVSHKRADDDWDDDPAEFKYEKTEEILKDLRDRVGTTYKPLAAEVGKTSRDAIELSELYGQGVKQLQHGAKLMKDEAQKLSPAVKKAQNTLVNGIKEEIGTAKEKHNGKKSSFAEKSSSDSQELAQHETSSAIDIDAQVGMPQVHEGAKHMGSVQARAANRLTADAARSFAGDRPSHMLQEDISVLTDAT